MRRKQNNERQNTVDAISVYAHFMIRKTPPPRIQRPGVLYGCITYKNGAVALRQGRKEKKGAVANGFYICDSPITVGAEGVYYSKPSPAGKGDREAVDEENILRWPRVTDIQLYRAMQHALLMRPLAPSTTSWSPSLPEGGMKDCFGRG